MLKKIQTVHKTGRPVKNLNRNPTNPVISPGKDPLLLKKKDFQVSKWKYRCAHDGCSRILFAQSWRLHIETEHINGRRTFIRKHENEVSFKCTECDLELVSRKERELHRRKVHNQAKRRSEAKKRRREAKALEKQQKKILRTQQSTESQLKSVRT